MTSRSISVVVPVYNSARILGDLVGRLVPVLDTLANAYEIILVNDGSRDSSWAEIVRLSERYPVVRGIDLMRNYGQHNALLCGIRAARYETLVTMDDDLQHPPEEIPTLLGALEDGLDVVYGVPEHQQHGLWRDAASWINKLALQGIMGAQTARKVSAFRVFRTYLREAFASYRSPFVSIDVLLTWATARFGSVVVRHNPRLVGASNYTFRKLTVHALNMMTGFSTMPLQLASLVGFAFTALGILILLYVIGVYIALGGTVPGFPFLASMIAIFSGAQLFALGIIGEYMARMHFRTLEKPTYATRSRTGGEEDGTLDGERDVDLVRSP